MYIIEYKRPLSGVLDEGEWWERFTKLLQDLGAEKANAVRIEDASFDYEYGSIKGVHIQTDIYIDDNEKEEIFLAGFPKRLIQDLTYMLEDNLLADTDKVVAKLNAWQKVQNGVLITVTWTVRNGIEFETYQDTDFY